MNFRTNESGSVMFYEYYYLKDGSRKQMAVTMPKYNKVNERRAKAYLVRQIMEKGGSLKPPRTIKQKKKERKQLPEKYVPLKYLFKKVLKDWEHERVHELKPSTFIKETKLTETYFASLLNRDIRKLTTADIQEIFQERMYLKYATLKKIRDKFNIFFRYAIRLGYVESNPAKNVHIPKKPLTDEDYQRMENKYLTLEEMQIFVSFLHHRRKSYPKMSIHFIYLAEFLFHTGLRIGEAIALKWEDVDLEKRELTVSHTFDYYSNSVFTPVLQTPKTRASRRTISLNKRSREIIEELRDLKRPNRYSGEKFKELNKFIFRGETGGLVNPYNFNTFLKKQSKRCFPEKKHFSLSSHSFRHSHITLLVEKGLPLKAIMNRVGHADEATTLRIYTHVTKQMTDVIAEAIEDL